MDVTTSYLYKMTLVVGFAWNVIYKYSSPLIPNHMNKLILLFEIQTSSVLDAFWFIYQHLWLNFQLLFLLLQRLLFIRWLYRQREATS